MATPEEAALRANAHAQSTAHPEVDEILQRKRKTRSQRACYPCRQQQNLKNQNAELREEIRSIRTQLDAFSASLPSTRSWASIAACRSATESGTSLSLTTSGENPNREPNCLRISTQLRPDDVSPITDTLGWQ
jgi:hypothetical protein